MSLPRVVILPALLLAAAPAAASTPDLFGLGSPAAAAAGAVAATAGDFSACFHDPAGLAAADRASLHLGWSAVDARLRAGDRNVDLEHAGGFVFGFDLPLALPLPWLPGLAFGLAVHAPPAAVVAIRARPPDEPAFPYYEGRTARWLVLPALALRLPAGWSAGVALDLFAGIRGPFELREGPTGAVEGRAASEMYSTAAPIAGLRWAPLDVLALAVTWRAEFSAPAAAAASVEAGGASTGLTASIAGLFRPHTLILGAAWTPRRGSLEIDLSWARWSAFRGAAADVAAELQGVRIDPREVELPFRDAFGVRLGGEYRFALGRVGFALRGGYAFESRILPEDAPGAARLDGDRHRLATGFGLGLDLDDETALRLDAHLAAEWVAGASALVPTGDPGAPAERVEGRGVVLAAGATLGMEWR
ncbi:MAG: hypothetical protein GYA57_14945 [Myxococcales bacterium]|nr:hypothetical protein [Myxococcales bacterium]